MSRTSVVLTQRRVSKQGCEHFTALKPFYGPILQAYDIEKLPSADASMRVLYSS